MQAENLSNIAIVLELAVDPVPVLLEEPHAASARAQPPAASTGDSKDLTSSWFYRPLRNAGVTLLSRRYVRSGNVIADGRVQRAAPRSRAPVSAAYAG
jgi:hypothetical protein